MHTFFNHEYFNDSVLQSSEVGRFSRIAQGQAQTNQAPHFHGWSNEVEHGPPADPGNTKREKKRPEDQLAKRKRKY